MFFLRNRLLGGISGQLLLTATLLCTCLVAPAAAQNKELLVGWWTNPGSSSAWPGYASNGVNFLHFSGATYYSPSQVNSYLNTAQSLGMKVSVSMTISQNVSYPWTGSQFTTFVNGIKSHPAIWGWYLADEPDLASDPALAHSRLLTDPGYYPLVKAADPNRPAWLVLSGSVKSGWNDVADSVAIDLYPSYGTAEFQNSQTRGSYDTWRSGLNWANTYNKKPFVAVVQGFGAGHGLWDDLTLPEMKYHVMTAVVQGVDKILFWCDEWANSWTLNIAGQVQRMIRDMRTEMENGIPNDPSIVVSQPTTSLAYNHGANGNRHAILAVNIANRSSISGATLSNVQFTLPAGVTTTQVDVLDENRSIPVTNGSFTDTFNPFQVHAYVFTASTTASQVAAPSISPSGATFTDSVAVTLATSTTGASMRYSTDGSTPTLPYSTPITVTKSATLKAQAVKSGMTDSTISSGQFTIQAAAPTMSPNGGTFTGSTSVSLFTVTQGAAIKYSLDGSAPSITYSGPITISQSGTLSAQAVSTGMANSPVSTASFTINPAQVVAPVISPNGGTFTGSTSVTLTAATGASIFYGLNGAAPSVAYSGPITIAQSMTLNAKAVLSGTSSAVSSASFTINPAQVAAPVISPNGGTFTGSTSVSLATATAGASIRYSLDGSTPSLIYSAPITITQSATLRAQAVLTGMANSNISAASFTINPNPTMSIAITSPTNNSRLRNSTTVFTAAVSGSVQKVVWMLDGVQVGSTSTYPFSLPFNLSTLNNGGGWNSHSLAAIASNSTTGQTATSTTVNFRTK